MSKRKRGRRNEGWIRERDGVQYACFKYKGRLYRESSRSARLGDAQKVLDRMRREILSGTYLAPRERAKQSTGATVSALAKRWLETRVAVSRNEKDQRTAEARVRLYLTPALGRKTALDLAADDLRGYRLWLEAYKNEHDRKLSQTTVGHILADARNLLLWAEEIGAIRRSPFPKKLMPKLQELAPKALNEDEAAAVSALPEPYGFACRVMLSTGIRWGELVRLRASDLQNGDLLIAAPKTKKLRRVPVPAAVRAEIQGHVGKLVPFESEYVASFDRMVRRQSGVKGFGAHQCRHTFATRWLAQGGNLGALQVALGHASITTTMRYAKPTEELLKHEAHRLWTAQAREA